MDVSKIMVESFDMLLNRDKNLKGLEDKADELKRGSAGVSATVDWLTLFIA
jgi:hypothetical protein